MLGLDVTYASQGPPLLMCLVSECASPSQMRGVELLGVEVKTSGRGEFCAHQSRYSSRDCPLRSR